MKLMILGASHAQLNAIKRAKESGIVVLATDYLEDSIGKKYADEQGLASTFDVTATLDIAKSKQIDGIMTTGTDQPVLTVNRVAHALGLPAFLNNETAYRVTNKRAMKQIFTKKNIPTVDYRLIERDFSNAELSGLAFPVVVKPLDSQGQRGVFKLNTIEEIRLHFDEVLKHSRENEILVESYYKNEEITISGWVKNGQAKLLTVTDRVTFEEDDKIGICLAHEFPSKHLSTYQETIKAITYEIVEAFHIKEGPIYFQMLIGDEGIKVNEVACRIGGAYEDEVIPMLTGIDILKMVIDFSVGNPYDITALEAYDYEMNKKYASVQLFFLKQGRISNIPHIDELKNIDGVYSVGFFYKENDEVKAIRNATARAGYAIITAESQEMLKDKLKMFYEKMQILDSEGQNMVIHA